MSGNSAYENELLKQIKNIEISLKYYMQKNKGLENELNYYKVAYENRVNASLKGEEQQDIDIQETKELDIDEENVTKGNIIDAVNDILIWAKQLDKKIKDKE